MRCICPCSSEFYSVVALERTFMIFRGSTLYIARKRDNFSSGKAAAKSLQSCPTLLDPIDGSPPGSPIPGTLQARTLEWVAISFSSA